jgi:putative oxidoreductase
MWNAAILIRRLQSSPDRDLAFLGTNISGEEFEDLHEQREPVGKLLISMIKTLLQTDSDYVYTFLRIIAGIIVFPYGMQKLFGWSGARGFGAPGIKASLEQITARNIPKFIAWLIIIGQSFGSIALMSGFLGRIAAGGLFIIFTGALIVHLPDGWTLNWFGSKKGEGIEYFVLLLSLLLVIVLKGSGARSVDLWLTR